MILKYDHNLADIRIKRKTKISLAINHGSSLIGRNSWIKERPKIIVNIQLGEDAVPKSFLHYFKLGG